MKGRIFMILNDLDRLQVLTEVRDRHAIITKIWGQRHERGDFKKRGFSGTRTLVLRLSQALVLATRGRESR